MPIALLATQPEFWVAVALLLLAYAALTLFRKPLETLLGSIPYFGGQIVAAIESGLSTVTNWALQWARTGVDAVVQVVWVPIYNLAALILAVAAFAGVAAGYLAALPGTIARLSYNLTVDIQALATRAIATTAAIASLVASLPSRIAAVASALDAKVAAGAAALVASARAALTAAITAAVAPVARALTALDARVTAGLAALTSVVAADVVRLEGVIGTDVRGLQGELAGLHSLVDPLVAAGLLTLVPALAQELTKTIEECVTPTCNVTTPQLDVLNALLSGATLALAGAAVAEAVANPEAAARETAGLLSGIEGAATGLATTFAGIHI